MRFVTIDNRRVKLKMGSMKNTKYGFYTIFGVFVEGVVRSVQGDKHGISHNVIEHHDVLTSIAVELKTLGTSTQSFLKFLQALF